MKLIALLSVAIVSLATAQKLQVDKATSLNETQEQQQQMPVISGDGSGSLLDSTSGSQDLSASTSASGSWGDFFVGDSDSASASDESASSEETSEASVESSSGSESSATTSLSASGDVSGFESSSSGESDLGSLPDTTSESQAASAATSASGSYGGSDADSDAASESSEESDSSSDASASSTTTSLSASASGDASGSVSSGSNKMGLDSLLDSASGSQEEGASKGASGSTDDVFDSDSEAESASSASDDSGSSSETSAASLPASSSGDASGFAASGSGEIDQSKSETQEGSTATSASESSSETESNAALQESAASEDNGSSTTPLSASASGSASSFSDQSSPVYSTSGSQDASDSTSASGSSTDVNVGDSDSASTSEESGSSGSPPTPAPTEAPTPAPAPTTPPISVDDSVQLSESFGGPHGNEFSDERAATSGQTVASITIRAGERVDGVILDITAPVAITLNHGGGGGNPNTLTLGPGEYITSMEAHWGEKKGHTRIFYLRFGTSAGNSVEGGSMTDSKATVTAPDGFQLGGFFGRDGDEIDLLGAIWTSIVPITPAPGAPTPAPTPWVEKIIDHDAVVPFKQPEPVTISEKAAIKFKPQLHITNGSEMKVKVHVGTPESWIAALPESLKHEFSLEELEQMKQQFTDFDTSGDGSIAASELIVLMESMGITTTLEEVQELIDKVDENRSGELEYPEFVRLVSDIRRGDGDKLAIFLQYSKHVMAIRRELLDLNTQPTLNSQVFGVKETLGNGKCSFEDLQALHMKMESSISTSGSDTSTHLNHRCSVA
ncbi:hypothetical protein PC116_g13808 [Phytophthora cactorum]|nr:hypothetical protein PC116_g13808 [Phytophthora cactorum]